MIVLIVSIVLIVLLRQEMEASVTVYYKLHNFTSSVDFEDLNHSPDNDFYARHEIAKSYAELIDRRLRVFRIWQRCLHTCPKLSFYDNQTQAVGSYGTFVRPLYLTSAVVVLPKPDWWQPKAAAFYREHNSALGNINDRGLLGYFANETINLMCNPKSNYHWSLANALYHAYTFALNAVLSIIDEPNFPLLPNWYLRGLDSRLRSFESETNIGMVMIPMISSKLLSSVKSIVYEIANIDLALALPPLSVSRDFDVTDATIADAAKSASDFLTLVHLFQDVPEIASKLYQNIEFVIFYASNEPPHNFFACVNEEVRIQKIKSTQIFGHTNELWISQAIETLGDSFATFPYNCLNPALHLSVVENLGLVVKRISKCLCLEEDGIEKEILLDFANMENFFSA